MNNKIFNEQTNKEYLEDILNNPEYSEVLNKDIDESFLKNKLVSLDSNLYKATHKTTNTNNFEQNLSFLGLTNLKKAIDNGFNENYKLFETFVKMTEVLANLKNNKSGLALINNYMVDNKENDLLKIRTITSLIDDSVQRWSLVIPKSLDIEKVRSVLVFLSENWGLFTSSAGNRASIGSMELFFVYALLGKKGESGDIQLGKHIIELKTGRARLDGHYGKASQLGTHINNAIIQALKLTTNLSNFDFSKITKLSPTSQDNSINTSIEVFMDYFKQNKSVNPLGKLNKVGLEALEEYFGQCYVGNSYNKDLQNFIKNYLVSLYRLRFGVKELPENFEQSINNCFIGNNINYNKMVKVLASADYRMYANSKIKGSMNTLDNFRILILCNIQRTKFIVFNQQDPSLMDLALEQNQIKVIGTGKGSIDSNMGIYFEKYKNRNWRLR